MRDLTPSGENFLKALLVEASSINASDIHLAEGRRQFFRVGKELIECRVFLDEEERQATEKVLDFLVNYLKEELPELYREFQERREIDFSFSFEECRIRVHLGFFEEKRRRYATLRKLPSFTHGMRGLMIPEEFARRVPNLEHGLVLISGRTRMGKTTTAVSLLNEIISRNRKKAITFEDPYEFELESGKGMVIQKSKHRDFHSFSDAIRRALRDDPDIIFVGEVRDRETAEAVLEVAETGHLTITTLHARSAANTLERFISFFKEEERKFRLFQLSSVLEVVLYQVLVPSITGRNMLLATELMFASEPIRALIKQGNFGQLINYIDTPPNHSLRSSLKRMVKEELISEDIFKFLLRTGAG